jgi:hypothetical protein
MKYYPRYFLIIINPPKKVKIFSEELNKDDAALKRGRLDTVTYYHARIKAITRQQVKSGTFSVRKLLRSLIDYTTILKEFVFKDGVRIIVTLS